MILLVLTLSGAMKLGQWHREPNDITGKADVVVITLS